MAITLAGREYVLPPINCATHRLFAERLRAFEMGQEQDPLGLVADIVQAALRRNHADVPPDLAEQVVDLDNANELMSACMGQAAWRRWLDQQAAEAAKTEPGKPQAAGTGDRSTPASPPPLDGLTLLSIN